MQQGGIILGMQKDKWNKEFRVKKKYIQADDFDVHVYRFICEMMNVRF